MWERVVFLSWSSGGIPLDTVTTLPESLSSLNLWVFSLPLKFPKLSLNKMAGTSWGQSRDTEQRQSRPEKADTLLLLVVFQCSCFQMGRLVLRWFHCQSKTVTQLVVLTVLAGKYVIH